MSCTTRCRWYSPEVLITTRTLSHERFVAPAQDLVDRLGRRLLRRVEPEADAGRLAQRLVEVLGRDVAAVGGLRSPCFALRDDVGPRREHDDVQRPRAD